MIETQAANTLLGDAINYPFPDLCAGLKVRDLGDRFRGPFESSIPALLISGTLDGRTPVLNGEKVLSQLTRGQHLVIDGAGHSDPLFLSSPRILECMQAFMQGEKIPVDRIELDPVELLAPRQVVAVAEETLAHYAGTYRISEDSIRAVFQVGPLLYSRRDQGQVLPLRPTSESAFFYEGSLTHVEFAVDEGNRVTHMTVYHDGSDEGEIATRID